MSAWKEIKSIEELFAYVNELEQGGEFQPIKFTWPISLSLHIEGPSWDRRFDKRTAQYVVELQKALEHMLEEFAPEVAPLELLVKVDSREGSWDSLADITSFLEILADKMTGEQFFYLIALTIALFGGYKIYKT